MQFFEKYLVEDKKASANTLSSYLRDIRQLADFLGEGGLVDASPEGLATYIAEHRSAGKSVATVSRTISSIKCLYAHFLSNSSSRLTLPKG